MAPIRDQGQRGTCVAFAVTAGHEASRGPASNPDDLSEEALYWGCKTADGDWHGGTTFSSARTAITRWGQPLEARWPYNQAQADGAEVKLPAGMRTSDWCRSGLRRISVAVANLQALLAAGTPVVLGLTVFDTLFRPGRDGRVQDPPARAPHRGLHAVLAVGYEPGFVLIRNSWGAGWAVGGYGWITEAYVNRFVIDAWIVDRAASGTSRAKSKLPASREQGAIYGSR
jgi:C1A family cysteine protease